MGFQHMVEVVHKAASRKGGKWKIKKGLGAMSPERRREIASMGGKKSYEVRSQKAGQKEVRQSDDSPRVADVLGDLDG